MLLPFPPVSLCYATLAVLFNLPNKGKIVTLTTTRGAQVDASFFLQRLAPAEIDEEAEQNEDGSAADEHSLADGGGDQDVGNRARKTARFLAVFERVTRSSCQLALDSDMHIVWADVEFARMHAVGTEALIRDATASKRVSHGKGHNNAGKRHKPKQKQKKKARAAAN